MHISLNWLKDLVPVDLPAEELAEKLTMVGFEVEDIEDRSTWADGVVVGKVLTCDPHPDADKLRVCTVDIGAEEPSQIVCGAPNVAVGLYVPVATVGTRLPSMGIKIKKAKLRGVPSHGMICSLTELGLETDIDGIHSFGDNVQVGADVRPLLGLDDVILDLTSTANRADALSMVGVAREVSALTGAKVKLPEIPEIKSPSAAGVAVQIADPKACPVYIATVVENVTITLSPDWLKQRLLAAGTRPINNVVDITNYILLEWGQPLHAFDAQSLPKGKDGLALGVRFAKDGEKLTTLDSEVRSLTSESLIITAADQPVALAGVMGGEDSEVKETTTTLVLEAALFDALTVRRSARPHSLRTEASARYERGVNETQLDTACNHALKLLAELAGGQVTAQAIVDHRTSNQRSIELRLERINQILGPIKGTDGQPTQLQASQVTQILEALGFLLTATSADQAWNVAVPPHRHRDIEREIDLIEEIARLHGYDQFCETLPAKTEPGLLPPQEKFTQKLRQVMRGAGLTELLHYSWVKPSSGGEELIRVVNPLLIEFSALRTELLTGIINAFAYNLEQGNGPLNGFEWGRIFWKEGETLKEANAIAGILGGDPAVGKWTRGKDRDRTLSWFEAKGRLEQIFEQMGLPIEYRTDPGDERLHPGRTASLWLNGIPCGRFGQLHPQLCQTRDLPEATYVFELNQDVLLEQGPQTDAAIFSTYSSYPAIDRDLAFFIATDTPVQDIEQTIWKAAKSGKLLDSVELFDEYKGESVPEGQRSLAFRLIYRVGDRTLTEDDVSPIHEQVRKALVDQLNASLRS